MLVDVYLRDVETGVPTSTTLERTPAQSMMFLSAISQNVDILRL